MEFEIENLILYKVLSSPGLQARSNPQGHVIWPAGYPTGPKICWQGNNGTASQLPYLQTCGEPRALPAISDAAQGLIPAHDSQLKLLWTVSGHETRWSTGPSQAHVAKSLSSTAVEDHS